MQTEGMGSVNGADCRRRKSMIFNYEGNPNKPVAILIHPMFTNSECYQEIVPLLKEKYYVMLPVLDGHYKGSIFVSVDNETRQIEREIERKKLGRIKMLLGISLGATIALDYFAKNSNRVAQVYLDGAPIFYWKHLSKIGNKIFYRIVREMQKDPQRGEEKMNHYF